MTVYHSFRDEVEVYREHWWKCNGPCQNKPPYYGIVKRAMNRPPSKADYWWQQHTNECGGQYTKIREPEPAPTKRKAKPESPSPAPSRPVLTIERAFEIARRKLQDDKMSSESTTINTRSVAKPDIVSVDDDDDDDSKPALVESVERPVKTSAPPSDVVFVDEEPERVECPICCQCVVLEHLNDHIDQGCPQR